MSVETLIGRNPAQILEAQSYVGEKAKKERESGHTRSSVHIVASTFIDEGRKELKEISDRLTGSGVRINPESTTPLFQQIPLDDRKPASLAYTAVTFGVTMITFKKLLEEKVFTPREMANLFNYSVDGTFIPKWKTNGLGEIEVPKPKQRLLNELAHSDPSLSIIPIKRMDLIPDKLKKVITNVGLFPFATRAFVPSYRDNVGILIRENTVRKGQHARTTYS